MRFHITGRQAGKTHKALAWLAEDPAERVIVTMSHAESERLLRDFRRLFPHQKANVTAGNFVAGSHGAYRLTGRRNTKVYVDNVDLVLRSLFGNVVAASATGEVEPRPDSQAARQPPPGNRWTW